MSDRPGKNTSRVVRVFVSSTFHDMQQERDLLVRKVFPEIRRRCRQRQVDFVEVDLRWGIVREQAERGEVLPICFGEIDSCRPYFIGLLGERYGWVPDRLAEEVTAAYPWLEQYSRRSATELEILHGVLNRPDTSRKAFFYFRDEATSRRIEASISLDSPDDPNTANKLKDLKERIRTSGLPLKEGYSSCDELGEQILIDLWQAIDVEFPAGSEPTEFENEMMGHDSFAATRRQVYVDVTGCLAQLDAATGARLLVVGGTGAGKSSLLVNWVQFCRERTPDVFIFEHYIGATAQSANPDALVRRLLESLSQQHLLVADIPLEDAAMLEQFEALLSATPPSHPIIIVLDGIDKIIDSTNVQKLSWLPKAVPAHVRIVLTSAPGAVANDLERQGYNTLLIPNLRSADIVRMVEQCLLRFGKKLEPVLISRVAAAPQCANPGFVRLLVDELRIFGIYEQLEQRLMSGLAAQNTVELCDAVLHRLESDHNPARPDLVRATLSLLAAARHGISEFELRQILAGNGDLPMAVWSPLFAAISGMLTLSSTLLRISDPAFKDAIRRRYLASPKERQQTHGHLADYFEVCPQPDRQVQECAWHLLAAAEWERLHKLLREPKFFAGICQSNWVEFRQLWAELHPTLRGRIQAYYLSSDARDIACVAYLAQLIEDTSAAQAAAPLWSKLNDLITASPFRFFWLYRSGQGIRFVASEDRRNGINEMGAVLLAAEYQYEGGQKFPLFRREPDAIRRYAQKILNLAGSRSGIGDFSLLGIGPAKPPAADRASLIDGLCMYQRARVLYERLNDLDRVVWILSQERRIQQRLRNVSGLADDLRRFERKARIRCQPVELARLLIERAIVESEMGHPVDSRASLDEAEAILRVHCDANASAACDIARRRRDAGPIETATPPAKTFWSKLFCGSKETPSRVSDDAFDPGAAPALYHEWELNLLENFAQSDPEVLVAGMDCIRAAAGANDRRAQHMLGDAYRRGNGAETDMAEAMRWYQKSADAGYHEAQARLGIQCLLGEGIAHDPEAAVRWLGAAAAQYNASAVEVLPRATEFLQKIAPLRAQALAGDLEAQRLLYQVYLRGNLGVTNSTEAARWLNLAAAQDDPIAQTVLAGMYLRGDGVVKDYPCALRLYRRGAEHGTAAAQDMLGILYREGEIVERDHALAVDWFRAAAEQGNRFAQFHLAQAYIAGEGVPPDIQEAIGLLRAAAAQGHDEAAKWLESIAD